jgi:septum formation protein
MSLWRGDTPLVLASKSEVRRALLQSAGIPVEVMPAEIDERAVEARHATAGTALAPAEAAVLLAREKALAVAHGLPGRLVVGADQTLALGDRRLTKPADRRAACGQLMALRGRTHALHSGVAAVQDGAVLFQHVASAQLTMRPFSDGFLEAYLDAAGDAVLHSVGGYQLEGLGVQLLEQVDGDHATILGLPLLPLLHFLRQGGWIAD